MHKTIVISVILVALASVLGACSSDATGPEEPSPPAEQGAAVPATNTVSSTTSVVPHLRPCLQCVSCPSSACCDIIEVPCK